MSSGRRPEGTNEAVSLPPVRLLQVTASLSETVESPAAEDAAGRLLGSISVTVGHLQDWETGKQRLSVAKMLQLQSNALVAWLEAFCPAT